MAGEMFWECGTEAHLFDTLQAVNITILHEH